MRVLVAAALLVLVGCTAPVVSTSPTPTLDDLRKAFAAGLTVSVMPRPITVAAGYDGVEATWTEAGRAPRRAVMNLLLRGDTWYWYAVNVTP